MGNDRDRVLELTGAAAYQAGIAEGRRTTFEKAAAHCDEVAAKLSDDSAKAKRDGDTKTMYRLNTAFHVVLDLVRHFREQAKEKEGE